MSRSSSLNWTHSSHSSRVILIFEGDILEYEGACGYEVDADNDEEMDVRLRSDLVRHNVVTLS